MNDYLNNKNQLAILLIKSFEGCIKDEEVLRLNEILENDPEAKQYYYEFVKIGLAMRRIRSLEIIMKSRLSDVSEFQEGDWAELAEFERTAPPVVCQEPIQQDKKSPELIQKINIQTVRKKTNISSILIKAISIAAIILVFIYVYTHPRYPKQVVASVVESVDAEWDGTKKMALDGNKLWNQTAPQFLTNGFLKIRFFYGAEVVIEAPAEFLLESPERMQLTYGRLFAHVPQYATGFVVKTPHSNIMDLGTDFGIKVGSDGATDVHMLKGKAALTPLGKNSKITDEVIEAGFAKRIDTTGQIRSIKFQNNEFAREISAESKMVWRGQDLSLADIVGGGNGLGTGQINAGIDPVSGKFSNQLIYSTRRSPTLEFRNVLKNPYIDGVFVPDASAGSVQIDSDGHLFSDCPDTDGLYWTQITYGAKVGLDTSSLHQASMEGIQYGTKRHPSILLVPNAGITFDLEAIRSALPDAIRITKFTTRSGISQTVLDIGTESLDSATIPNPKVDFMVLIDGRICAEQKHIVAGQKPAIHAIEISETDRFLTLVATDGGDGNYVDWFICTDPILKLESEP